MIDKTAIIIPGPRKCGTTTLYQLIGNHPDVATPKISEPQLFALPENVISSNLEWYKNLFNEFDKKTIIDGSTLCFSHQKSPIFIKKIFRNPKVIIILRDPAKRAYSAYLHMKKLMPQVERRDFSSILNEIKGPNISDIISSENKSIKQALENDMISSRRLDETFLKRHHNIPFKSDFEDVLWEYKYFQGSIYSKKINHWKRILKNKMKIIFLEDLISNQSRIIDELWNFTGLTKIDINLPHANDTSIPNKSFQTIFYPLINSNIFNKTIKKINCDFLCKKIKSTVKNIYFSKPSLSKEEYHKIRILLKEEYDFWMTRYPILADYWKYEKKN